MTKISATILTHNEAAHIEACLESLRDVADEIIVVDSFSTDATVDICRNYGCRITRRRIAGFGAQRQYATSLTSHSYVLAIDADEALSPALRQSLIELKKRGCTHRGYMMARLNFFCGYAVKHGGWYPDFQVRLFDKRFASWSLRDVNEQVIFHDNVTPELLAGDLLHYRCSTAAEYKFRCLRQAEIQAASIAKADGVIGPVTPSIHGLKHFLHTYISCRGILDGSIGFAISRQHYIATRHAYRTARKLQKSKK
ncbi:MAG: glycosyltransferase family 2 protein [Firmicutes bacterium]|nr:glycosyltransferase family 2 protein [Bacillota bacterium]MCM1400456.1 glycosyltransferase family 2 protein [Bacteroides sp.]MCM1477427.1 glycosyltransferase family 2 protein [Bacteroides sp.]